MTKRLLWIDDAAIYGGPSVDGDWLIDGGGETPDVEETHKTVFDAIHAYPHPGISAIDAELIGDAVLIALGIANA